MLQDFLMECFEQLVIDVMRLPLGRIAKMRIIDLLLEDENHECA